GEVLLPLVDLDVQLANGTESKVRSFADLTLGFGLQWAPKKIGNGVFVHRAVIDVGVPTGKYSDSRPANLGNHFVVVDPYYAFTYERKKMEFSVRLHYLWNSTNNDPFVGFGIKSMQPGQAFHVNYATSYEVFKNVRLGFNGYWLQQLTDHRINNVDVPYSRERTVGLGPGLQLGGRDIWFRLNGYLETDVRHRPRGVKVTFRISKTLPKTDHLQRHRMRAGPRAMEEFQEVKMQFRGVRALEGSSQHLRTMHRNSHRRNSVSNEDKRYDYIVVGAGAAGSVLAAELSASGAQVLVVESGGPDDTPTIMNPSIWFYNVGGPLDYHLPITPSPRLNNRKFNM